MILAFFLRYWLHAVLITALVGGLSTAAYTGYKYIYDKGYKVAEDQCKERIKDYEDKLLARIDTIEKNSTIIIEQNEALKEASARDFRSIMKATKGRPLYTIQAGVCAPSEDFVKAYNDAMARANQK